MPTKYFMEMSVQLDETSDHVIEKIRPLKDNSPALRQALADILGLREQDIHPGKPVSRDPARAEKGHHLGDGDAVYTLFVDMDKVVEVASGCGCADTPHRGEVTFEVIYLDEDNLHPYAPAVKLRKPGFPAP